MSGPFATYFGNQRVVAIPVTPTLHRFFQASAGGFLNTGALTLSAANLAANVVQAYCYYITANIEPSAAISAVTIFYQFQFRNAAHAAVGGGFAFLGGSMYSGAGGVGMVHMPAVMPAVPIHYSLSPIPGTAVEVSVDANVIIIAGAPVVDCSLGWGIDFVNSGPPGDIGGGGIVAQSANNPNAF